LRLSCGQKVFLGKLLCDDSRFGYEEIRMQVYLLSVKELVYSPDDNPMNAVLAVRLRQRAIKMLDEHRREKVNNLKTEVAQSQAIGAGLLLQLAVQNERPDNDEVMELSVSEILEKLHEPIQIDYVYDIYGKPDFADASWHFNLSHSGEYVCLVTDNNPVGVDIQQMRPLKNYHLAERFFSEKELAKMESCINEGEKVECFYDIWVKKESYAKLTGEGIGKTVGLDTEYAGLPVCWRVLDEPEGYRVAICKAITEAG